MALPSHLNPGGREALSEARPWPLYRDLVHKRGQPGSCMCNRDAIEPPGIKILFWRLAQ
jgi:hypothetical protein